MFMCCCAKNRDDDGLQDILGNELMLKLKVSKSILEQFEAQEKRLGTQDHYQQLEIAD
jgi:hypothetical protein